MTADRPPLLIVSTKPNEDITPYDLERFREAVNRTGRSLLVLPRAFEVTHVISVDELTHALAELQANGVTCTQHAEGFCDPSGHAWVHPECFADALLDRLGAANVIEGELPSSAAGS